MGDYGGRIFYRPDSPVFRPRSQKCEMGGGANDESGRAAGLRRRGGEVWGGGVPLPNEGGGTAPPRNFFKNFLSRYAAFWVQSDAFSGIIRPVPNSLHSQPAESSDISKPASATLGKECRAF